MNIAAVMQCITGLSPQSLSLTPDGNAAFLSLQGSLTLQPYILQMLKSPELY